ncbi:MAG: hypothetical protein ABI444_04560, partial [Candidatus Kapaibacterium sp.]
TDKSTRRLPEVAGGVYNLDTDFACLESFYASVLIQNRISWDYSSQPAHRPITHAIVLSYNFS